MCSEKFQFVFFLLREFNVSKRDLTHKANSGLLDFDIQWFHVVFIYHTVINISPYGSFLPLVLFPLREIKFE